MTIFSYDTHYIKLNIKPSYFIQKINFYSQIYAVLMVCLRNSMSSQVSTNF